MKNGGRWKHYPNPTAFFTVSFFLLSSFSLAFADAANFTELCRKGTLEQVKAAIVAGESGVDVNAANEAGQTSFLLAVRCGVSAAALRFLLRSGAAPQAVDGKGGTIWHYAARRNEIDRDTIKILQEYGTSIDQRDAAGMSPLMQAAGSAFSETVKNLIDAGADTKMKDRKGYTAYDYARGYRRPKNADVIFFKGSLLRIYLAWGFCLICMLIPASSLGKFFVLRFVRRQETVLRIWLPRLAFVLLSICLVFLTPPGGHAAAS
ncbi:MAG: ankyrin repeat domain-containing protein [Synergistaceae bacterium]|jgi:hypothetical protein|nr:ankyrin repeat domain-containing protein [Synergistaceae bacterium]